MRKIQQAVKILQEGGVIAYPTEAVFGLGCDPMNEAAVMKLLRLKNRAVTKGLILIASDWQQLEPFVAYIAPERLKKVVDTWPGPVTWVFPAAPLTPEWIRGMHSTVAVRVTDHPIAKELCHAFKNPIVSTSANLEGHAPARKEKTVQEIFDDKIDLIVSGEVGSLDKPTEIRDALTDKILRAG